MNLDDKQAVLGSLNRSLSGLAENPYLLRQVIAKAEGEKTMKKKISGGLVLAIVLIIALIGTACAAFSSQVVSYFREHWSKEMADWLEEGKAAQIGETVQVGGASVTLDEVVYRNHGLYAVGTIHALEAKDVLVPEDLMNEPGWFPKSEEGKTLIERVQATGGRLLTARCVPQQVGVDGGELLPTGGFSYFQRLNPDGSLSFALEMTDGLSVTEGSRYRLVLAVETQEWTKAGEEINGTYLNGSMTVDFVPKAIRENGGSENGQQLTVEIAQDYTLLVPDAYRECGTLPVYRAVEPDFTKLVTPDWFTDQPVAEENHSGQDAVYVTKDYGVLIVSPGGFYFSEYEGDYEESSAELDLKTAIYPEDALSRQIAELAERKLYDVYGNVDPGSAPFREQLHEITRQEAVAKAEEIMRRLGLTGYRMDFCLDMSVERIREMAEAWMRDIREGRYLTDDDRAFAFDQATEADEGYFLRFTPEGLGNVNRSRFMIRLFITGRGVPYANVSNAYLTGEILETPSSLVLPDSVLPALVQEMSQARSPKAIEKINAIALVYTPARGRDGGMVMTPTWHVTFQQKSNNGLERESWAEFNAVNGDLLDAEFL